jgi:quinol-cytochrome oxidoreductase complex cytochrome b subunit
MVGAILVLLIVPFINTSDVRNTTYFQNMFLVVLLLYYSDLGRTKNCERYFHSCRSSRTLYYFAFFMILIPLVGTIESKLVNYKSN